MSFKIISIQTQGPGLYKFTHAAREFVDEAPIADGILTVFVKHTSCSLLIQENADPDVQSDLQEYFSRLVPSGDHPSMAWMRHTLEGPDDMPAHIKAAMMPVSLSIPVAHGQMQLGTWQGLYLFEHRDHPHQRQVALKLMAG